MRKEGHAMNLRMRARAKGFTLIELLVVVAIIGIIAAMLIPNLFDAMQKAKQKRTVADIRIAGTSLFSWLTDQVGAAAAGATATDINLASYGSLMHASDLTPLLTPEYVQKIIELDGWKTPLQYYLLTSNPLASHVMAIRSLGRDRSADTDDYTVTGFDPTDYDRDIVWADGFFVRWPQK
jgi:prepilin-type N-terminal cleavage/methylation domain-containing protein